MQTLLVMNLQDVSSPATKPECPVSCLLLRIFISPRFLLVVISLEEEALLRRYWEEKLQSVRFCCSKADHVREDRLPQGTH